MGRRFRRQRWAFCRQLPPSAVAASLALLVSLILFVHTAHRLLQHFQEAQALEQRLATAGEVGRHLATAERSVWAYAGRGQDSSLRAYRAAWFSFQSEVNRMQSLLQEAPAERFGFVRLVGHAKEWHSLFVGPAVRLRGLGENTQPLLAAAPSEESLQRFHEELERFCARQRSQWQMVRADARKLGTRLAVVAVFLIAAGVLSATWWIRWLRRLRSRPVEQFRPGGEIWVGSGTAAPVGVAASTVTAGRDPTQARLEPFQSFTGQLQQGRDPKEIVHRFLRAIEDQFQPEQVLVLTAGPGADRFEVAGRLSPAPSDTATQITEPQSCPAVRHRRSFCVDDTNGEAVCACGLDVYRHGSYLCLPLEAHGRLLGLVTLSAPPRHWTRERSLWVECYAAQLASQLSTYQLLSEAQQQALMDDLTQLYNRRFAEEYLQRLLALGSRSPRPFGLLMLDLDYFKKFNDRFGHATGDRLLRTFATTVTREVRESAVVARWGGEEFMVLVPDVDPDAAQRVAERIRAAVARIQLAEPLSQLPLTVSIGVAISPTHGTTRYDLLDAADRALYRAKDAGRNRVHLATDVLSSV